MFRFLCRLTIRSTCCTVVQVLIKMELCRIAQVCLSHCNEDSETLRKVPVELFSSNKTSPNIACDPEFRRDVMPVNRSILLHQNSEILSIRPITWLSVDQASKLAGIKDFPRSVPLKILSQQIIK